MIPVDVIQGSDEWHRLRANSNTASEAPVMMGASSKMRRNELLHMKATGTEKEVTEWVQKNLFDKGHACEATARTIVEGMIGEDLYPITGLSDDRALLASFDGLTMLGDVGFEHKMWNEALAQAVRDKDLPAEYYWQLEQQLLVSGAERIIFVVSDGTEERFEYMDYYPVPGRAKALQDGWKQFDADLATYVPPEAKPVVVGRSPENLPALHIELTGKVSASNLDAFKAHALDVIGSINRDLQTDQDFANAEKAVKWCGEVESKLKAAKENALGQTATIDELFRALDDISASARNTRLELDKLVTAQKAQRKNEIQQGGITAFAAHVADLNAKLGPRFRLPDIRPEFAAVMKGKRTLATLQDAVDTELARVKIIATNQAELMLTNIASLRELANDHVFLFNDAAALVLKDNEALEAIIKGRIAEHQAAEKAKAEAAAEAERERIRKEERERLEKEQAAQAAEDARVAAEAAQQAVEPEPVPAPAAEPEVVTAAPPAQLELGQTVRRTARPAAKPEPAQSDAFTAEVTDLMALVLAVANGIAPLSVLQVDNDALHAAIAAEGGKRSYPGVRLSKAVAA